MVSPLVGALVGGVAAGTAWLSYRGHLPPLAVGLMTVGVLALGTRGMHLDGVADTADGLGCYGPPERARDVMRSGGAGPFGVAAIVFAVTLQATAFASLATTGRWPAIALAVVAGRVAVVAACGRWIGPAAPDSMFGSLVAESQSTAAAVVWGVLVLPLLSVYALAATSPGAPTGLHWVHGGAAAVLPLVASIVLVRHCVRRFGGLSGDVLGAAVEVTVTGYALIACLR